MYSIDAWASHQRACRVTYIGFLVNAQLGTLGLPPEKKLRILTLLRQIKKDDRVDRMALLKIAGTLLWVSCLLPYLKAWLNEFYAAANRPNERWLKATPWQTWEVLQTLTAEGVLRRDIPSLGVAEGWKLFKIGKTKLGNPARWKGWWPAKECMLGFYNPHTRRVRIQAKLEAVAQRWEHALLNSEQLLQCRMREPMAGSGAADAQAGKIVGSN